MILFNMVYSWQDQFLKLYAEKAGCWLSSLPLGSQYGFENTRRQDYYNKEFGLELEDMHDENVIVKDDLLFFIDTVFYIMERK